MPSRRADRAAWFERAARGRHSAAMRIAPIVLAATACLSATAQAQTIYRCSDGAGGVLYIDVPCRGGRVVEVPEFRADPTAQARLQRELDAFDKRQAAREAAVARQREQEADVRRRSESQARAAEERDAASAPYPYAYGFAPYYVPPQPPPRPRPRPIRPRDSYILLR